MILTVNDRDYLLDERSITFSVLLRCHEIEEQIKDKEIEEITAIDLYQFNEFIVECFEKYNISIDDLNQLSPTDVMSYTVQLIIECKQIIPKVEDKICSIGNKTEPDERPAVQSDYELLLRIISDLVGDGEDLNHVLKWSVMRYFDIVYYRCLEKKRGEPAPADLIDSILGI